MNPAKQPASFLALSMALHAGAVLWLVQAPLIAPQRSRVVEIELREPPPPPPKPVLAAAVSAPHELTHIARKAEAHKSLPPVAPQPAAPQPESEPTPEPSPVAAAPSQAATKAGTGGPPGGAPAGAPAGAPGGTALPIVGPSYGAAYLHNAPPKYPAMARRMLLEGTTTIRVLVGADGRPKHVKVQISSGVQVLDDAALEVVPTWSFVPAHQGDKPVAAEVDVPVRFKLEGAATD